MSCSTNGTSSQLPLCMHPVKPRKMPPKTACFVHGLYEIIWCSCGVSYGTWILGWLLDLVSSASVWNRDVSLQNCPKRKKTHFPGNFINSIPLLYRTAPYSQFSGDILWFPKSWGYPSYHPCDFRISMKYPLVI